MVEFRTPTVRIFCKNTLFPKESQNKKEHANNGTANRWADGLIQNEWAAAKKTAIRPDSSHNQCQTVEAKPHEHSSFARMERTQELADSDTGLTQPSKNRSTQSSCSVILVI